MGELSRWAENRAKRDDLIEHDRERELSIMWPERVIDSEGMMC